MLLAFVELSQLRFQPYVLHDVEESYRKGVQSKQLRLAYPESILANICGYLPSSGLVTVGLKGIIRVSLLFHRQIHILKNQNKKLISVTVLAAQVAKIRLPALHCNRWSLVILYIIVRYLRSLAMPF